MLTLPSTELHRHLPSTELLYFAQTITVQDSSW